MTKETKTVFPDVPESPEVLRSIIRDAVKYAQEGRESHVLWAEHLEAHARGEATCEACTPEVIETAGDAQVQREWVRKYDVILRALSAPLAPLMVEAIAKIGDEEEHRLRVRNARHALRYREEARRGSA